MANHSSILAWKIPWMEKPGGLQSMGSQESDTTERLHFHLHFQAEIEYSNTPHPTKVALHKAVLSSQPDGNKPWPPRY